MSQENCNYREEVSRTWTSSTTKPIPPGPTKEPETRYPVMSGCPIKVKRAHQQLHSPRNYNKVADGVGVDPAEVPSYQTLGLRSQTRYLKSPRDVRRRRLPLCLLARGRCLLLWILVAQKASPASSSLSHQRTSGWDRPRQAAHCSRWTLPESP